MEMKVTRIRLNWWTLALRGVAGLLLGIGAFVYTPITLTVIVLLFAAYLFVDGVFNLIAGFLADNHLQFLGFDQAPHILQRFREKFPEDQALTNLAHWDRFEQENPRAFIGMYQFWVQKPGG